MKKKRGDDETMERSWYISERYDKQTELGKCSKSSVCTQRDSRIPCMLQSIDILLACRDYLD
jgi:hypothetical protein